MPPDILLMVIDCTGNMEFIPPQNPTNTTTPVTETGTQERGIHNLKPLLYWKTYAWGLLFALACFWSAGDISTIIPPIPYIDKIGHFGFSAGLAALLVADVTLPSWLAIITGTGFGGIIELAQRFFTVSRSAEWSDLGADVAGVLFGVLFGVMYVRLFGPVTHKSVWKCFVPSRRRVSPSR